MPPLGYVVYVTMLHDEILFLSKADAQKMNYFVDSIFFPFLRHLKPVVVFSALQKKCL